MTTRIARLAVLCLCGFLMAGVGLYAHHAVAGIYDLNKEVVLEGKLKKLNFVNPHASIVLSVQDKKVKGKIVDWTLTTASVTSLTTRGFSKGTIKPGDPLKVTILPADQRQPGGIHSASRARRQRFQVRHRVAVSLELAMCERRTLATSVLALLVAMSPMMSQLAQGQAAQGQGAAAAPQAPGGAAPQAPPAGGRAGGAPAGSSRRWRWRWLRRRRCGPLYADGRRQGPEDRPLQLDVAHGDAAQRGRVRAGQDARLPRRRRHHAGQRAALHADQVPRPGQLPGARLADADRVHVQEQADVQER